MKPTNNRILCKEIIEETTKSGIILTVKDETKAKRYKVLSVADNIKDIKVDDVVYCGKYAGTPFEDCMIINYTDILGIELCQ